MLAPFGGKPQPLPPLASDRFRLGPKADLTLEMPAPLNGKSPYRTYRISRDGAFVAKRLELVPFGSSALDLPSCTGRYWSEQLGTVYDLVIIQGQLFDSSYCLSTRNVF
jgi:hypothetical protein